MPDVNIEYNPKDWGGYLKEYTTETEYNNAIKPLPHAARITGTQEVKFAGGYEPINSKKWIAWDNCTIDFDSFRAFEDFDQYLSSNYIRNGIAKYYLCGKLNIGNRIYYLWKWTGNYSTSVSTMDHEGYYYSKDNFVITLTDNINLLRPEINIDSDPQGTYCKVYQISGLLSQDGNVWSYHDIGRMVSGGPYRIGFYESPSIYIVYFAGEDQ